MRTTLFLMLALALFSLLWRVLPHGWNMTPVLALALFAGARLPHPGLRLALPLGVMLLSDLWLGFHATMPYVYAALALVVLMGRFLHGRGLAGHAGFSVSGSLLFFFLTNFGVWLSAGLYPLTLDGLIACFTLAIPFLWKTLAGDLFFVLAFYALFQVAERRLAVQGRLAGHS